jgi:secondary thiamine-phosphate synthase enzyme
MDAADTFYGIFVDGLAESASLHLQVGKTDMQETITLQTHQREILIDITPMVEGLVQGSGISNGIVNIYAQGATAAIMIQENWDESVQTDVVDLLRTMIPKGVWQHDAQDGNGDSHLKSGLVGPSETIPIIDGRLGLSTWQNVFFCEFDGPRSDRRVLCTIISDD